MKSQPPGRDLIADCHGAIGEEHPITLTAEHNYAFVLVGIGKPNEALPRIRKVIAGYGKIYPQNYPMLLGARSLLSSALDALGENAEAIEQAEILVEGRVSVLGPRHP